MSVSIVSGIFSPQVLFDVILEVVFPTCAMLLLPDNIVRHNAVTFSALKSGGVHRKLFVVLYIGVLISGSTAEGLTIHQGWGHPWPDRDCMHLLGAQFGVRIPGQQSPNSHRSCLEYAPDGCPPAYTRLQVTNKQALQLLPQFDTDCVEEKDGHHWLNTRLLNKWIQQAINKGMPDPVYRNTGISGPSGEVVILGSLLLTWFNFNRSLDQ